MQIIGFIIGIVSICIWAVAIIPFLGWINWFNIPLAAVGLVLSIMGVATSKGFRLLGIIGIVLCSIALFFGLARLTACGGII